MPAGAAPGTAYGRVIRERGTVKLVVGAVVLAVVWYMASAVQTRVLLNRTYPALSVDPNGLTVIGIQDKDRPGFQHKYEARESNHAWQIRYREDAPQGGDDED